MLKAHKIWRSLVAATLVAGTLATMLPVPAFAGAISGVTVVVSGTDPTKAVPTNGSTTSLASNGVVVKAGTSYAAKQYVVTFVTPTTIAVADLVTLTFPADTQVPTNAAGSALGGVTMTSSAGNMVADTLESNATNRTVIIKSKTAASGAGVTVTITIPAGFLVMNPSTAGNYKVTVVTVNDTVASSNAYVIDGPTISSVSAIPATPGAVAQYNIFFQTSKTLVANTDTITIKVPTSSTSGKPTVTLPATIAKSTISITGNTDGTGASINNTVTATQDATVDVNNGLITIVVPDMNQANVAGFGHNLSGAGLSNAGGMAGGTIVVSISSVAGIMNPAAAGRYAFKVTTSQEATYGGAMTQSVPGVAGTALTAFTMASDSFEVKRTLTLDKLKDVRGGVLKVTGTGFASTGTATLWVEKGGNNTFEAADIKIIDGVPITSSTFTATFNVGGGFVAGANSIYAMDGNGDLNTAVSVNSNSVLVTGASNTQIPDKASFTVSPSVSLSPTSGSIGSAIVVTLSDYTVSDSVVIATIGAKNLVNSAAAALAAASTDTVGALTFTGYVPATSPQGNQLVTISTAFTGSSATAYYNVAGAVLTANPSTIVPGQNITISGSGFTGNTISNFIATGTGIGAGAGNSNGSAGNNAPGQIALDGAAIANAAGTLSVDSGGSITIQITTLASGSVNAALYKAGTYNLLVSDGLGRSGTATVTILAPTLVLSPDTGLAGSVLTFSGVGMPSSSSVAVTYPVTTGAAATTTVTSDSAGYYSGTMTLPGASQLALPSINSVTASSGTGASTATAIKGHSIPAPSITVSPAATAPGGTITVTGKNFAAYTSLASMTVGTLSVAVIGVNTDIGGGFTMTTLVPGISAGTASVVVTVGTNTANANLTIGATAATVAATTVLSSLVNSQNLNIVTAFDYGTGKYQSYVPALAGNSLVSIAPNTVLFITMTKDTTVTVSGIAFNLKANVPTPLPVGAAVTIFVS